MANWFKENWDVLFSYTSLFIFIILLTASKIFVDSYGNTINYILLDPIVGSMIIIFSIPISLIFCIITIVRAIKDSNKIKLVLALLSISIIVSYFLWLKFVADSGLGWFI